MNYVEHINGFLKVAAKDARLYPSHISLYMALLNYWEKNAFANPILLKRLDLMAIAKISAKATYLKCIKELHNYGYIQYDPSHNSYRGTWVCMVIFGQVNESETA